MSQAIAAVRHIANTVAAMTLEDPPTQHAIPPPIIHGSNERLKPTTMKDSEGVLGAAEAKGDEDGNDAGDRAATASPVPVVPVPALATDEMPHPVGDRIPRGESHQAIAFSGADFLSSVSVLRR